MLTRLVTAASALVFAAILLATASDGAAAAEMRIAVVDVQRAVMSTKDGIRAQATLKKRFDKRQQELDGKQAELQHARDDIEKQSARGVSGGPSEADGRLAAPNGGASDGFRRLQQGAPKDAGRLH